MARVTGSRSEDTTGGSATYDISDVEVRAAAQPINLAAAERLVRIAWAILIAARRTTWSYIPQAVGNRRLTVPSPGPQTGTQPLPTLRILFGSPPFFVVLFGD